MEGGNKEFGICYRSLLAIIVDEIGGSKPVYIKRCEVGDLAAVVIRVKKGGNLAYYFEGGAYGRLEESENAAAKEAVLFLVKKKKLRILDFNLRKKEEVQACAAYYRAQRNKLDGVVEGGETEQNEGYSRSISIEYCRLLRDVLDSYGISVTAIKCIRLSMAQHVCLFGVRYDPAQVEWIMGSPGKTICLAQQYLARKALNYLQPLLHFDVIDLNFCKMKTAQVECSLERELYLSTRDSLAGAAELGLDTPPLSVNTYRTPQNPEAQIEAPTSPPPLPKKRRLMRGAGSEGPADDGRIGCLFEIPDDLSTIFKVTGRM